MDSEQNKEIIREVLQGRTEAFARLVERYKGPVFNLAYRMTGSRQDAEDLTQEAFLKAFLGLKRFERQRRFFPWLFAIAVNTVRNHLKKTASHRPARSDVGIPSPSSGSANNPEKNLADKQQRMQIAEALQKLPIEQREAVVLRYYQDLAFDDIAAVCDVPLSTAKMRVYRGIQKLAQIWDNHTA
jgi:RNA polymerase sigma-70 factor (ECF subfamily)